MQDILASPFVPLLAMFAVAYFLLLRPQQQRAKQLRNAIANVRRGDTVITAGGLVGKVVKVPAGEEPEITIEIADNVQVRVLKTTLSDIRAKSQPVESAK